MKLQCMFSTYIMQLKLFSLVFPSLFDAKDTTQYTVLLHEVQMDRFMVKHTWIGFMYLMFFDRLSNVLSGRRKN